MAGGPSTKAAHYSSSPPPTSDQGEKKERQPPPPEPRPSSSILLLSPTNQALLLQRVKTSSSFASAHVFPGGNLSAFHDGEVPGPADPARHRDSAPYRLAAVRETFEESGILLARSRADGSLLNLPAAQRDEARRAIHGNRERFVDWLDRVGGVADTENLIPFTRWITPAATPRRFTTQMYLYMLPLRTSDDPVLSAAETEARVPTPDGGLEHTTARFDHPAAWLARQAAGEATLFPPQCFLLHLVAQFATGPPPPLPSQAPAAATAVEDHYRAQRRRLRSFLAAVPTAEGHVAVRHPTSRIPWADKVISPETMGRRRADGRSILSLAGPGPELRGTGRGGDWERVVLVHFSRGSVRQVEVRSRAEVLEDERRAAREADEGAKL